jgi:hypothetical protein
MKYSISQAARIIGITRKTLYNHIDKKPISTYKDDGGNTLIEASELIRVYGDKCKFDRVNGKDENVTPKQDSTPISNDLKHELEISKLEISHLKKLIEKYENDVEVLTEALKRAQEGHNRATTLLEDKSGAGDSEDIKAQLKIAEQKIINQINSAREKIQTLLDTLKGQGAEISNYTLQFNAIKNTSLDINFSELESVLRSHRKLYKTLQTKLKKPTTQTKRSWFTLKRA